MNKVIQVAHGLKFRDFFSYIVNLILLVFNRRGHFQRLRAIVDGINQEGPKQSEKSNSFITLDGPKDLFFTAVRTLSSQGIIFSKPKQAKVKAFLEWYAPIITNHLLFTPLFPSVVIAQAALESGWGESADKTLFGIKSSKGVLHKTKEYLKTPEYPKGKWFVVKDRFASYPTLDKAIEGYIKLIRTRPWFRDVWKAQTPWEAAEALQGGRLAYATDPGYVKKITRIIKGYHLDYFDHIKRVIEQWRNL